MITWMSDKPYIYVPYRIKKCWTKLFVSKRRFLYFCTFLEFLFYLFFSVIFYVDDKSNSNELYILKYSLYCNIHNSSEKIFVGQSYSSNKFFVTLGKISSLFFHIFFCPTRYKCHPHKPFTMFLISTETHVKSMKSTWSIFKSSSSSSSSTTPIYELKNPALFCNKLHPGS